MSVSAICNTNGSLTYKNRVTQSEPRCYSHICTIAKKLTVTKEKGWSKLNYTRKIEKKQTMVIRVYFTENKLITNYHSDIHTYLSGGYLGEIGH